jgi:C-terminal processing protease CtpA/Prc
MMSIFLFTSTVYSQEAPKTVADSIHFLYDALFEELEENYLLTKDVDWAGLKPVIKKEALKSTSLEESLKSSIKLFDTIHGDHLILFSEKDWYKSTLGKQLSGEQFNQSLADAYTNGKPFEVRVLEDAYGYVLIPGMLLLNATREELDEAAQEIYDAILKIDQAHDIKGWILDLRVNIGGNSNVMLTGLYHLLGDGAIYLTLDSEKKVDVISSITNGVYYQNHKIVNAIKPTATPKPSVPVALLSGIITNSAGEFVLLGFRSRKNTIIIGEESYGSTTSNDLYQLPFGIKAAITESYGSDRSAIFTKTIIPEIEVIKETNFEDLPKDKNITEAIKFINSKQ